MNIQLKEKLSGLPEKPGVYLFKDTRGNVIYVGKAVSLRGRVRSYFAKQKNAPAKQTWMLQKIHDVDYVVTGSETEAFLVENTLIKKYRPRFNVHLRDDKTYPYIKITTQENFPKLQVVRKRFKDGATYFGPFVSAGSMRETLKLIEKLFPLATCSLNIDGSEDRPCLEYYIGRCAGPCSGEINKENYRRIVEQACGFLSGKTEGMEKELKEKMKEASGSQEYELAARYRDKLFSLQSVLEKQKAVLPVFSDLDCIGVARDEKTACVQILFVRRGKLSGQEYFILEHENAEETELLETFLKQYYLKAAFIPEKILLSELLNSEDILGVERFLSEQKESRVQFHAPQRGREKHLVLLSVENAQTHLESLNLAESRKKEEVMRLLKEMQDELSLPHLPRRIEAFDISNLDGTHSAGSMVVFTDAKPDNKEYRHFKIKTVEGIDDYAMMREVLLRRYRRVLLENLMRPDLILIDGGKGHLQTGVTALRELGMDIPAAGLAKQDEILFLAHKEDALFLPRDSRVLHVFQHIRDEAHRFAITYHRKLRLKGIKDSIEKMRREKEREKEAAKNVQREQSEATTAYV